jgi:hypothetical protein
VRERIPRLLECLGACRLSQYSAAVSARDFSRVHFLGLLLATGSAHAADAPAQTAAPKALVSRQAPAGKSDATHAATTADESLDLQPGDLRAYFPSGELETPLDERLDEIIVNGKRLEDIRGRQNVPQGVFPALFYAGRYPLDAWRIFAPVPNAVIPDRSEDDVKDPPGAYRGRILEPGAIFD